MQRVMVVTGGSRGIGAATCRLAATTGYAVAVNFVHDTESADDVVARCRAAGVPAIAVRASVADEASVEAMFDRVTDELGSPTVLVNNAGVLEQQMRLDEMTVDRWRRVFDVNVMGVRVNAVRPGVIHTEIHASGGEPGRVDRVAASVPMRRGGDPDEVARAILWLASDDASYMTATTVDVSGGR